MGDACTRAGRTDHRAARKTRGVSVSRRPQQPGQQQHQASTRLPLHGASRSRPRLPQWSQGHTPTPPCNRRCPQLARTDPPPPACTPPPRPTHKQELVRRRPRHRHGEDDLPQVEQRLDEGIPQDHAGRRRRRAAGGGHAGGAAPGRAPMRPLPVAGEKREMRDGEGQVR